MNKLNVLFWADTPTCSTGFGQVTKNILKLLYKTGKYNFNVLGINHNGDSYNHEEFPYNIDPATSYISNDTDLHGRGRLYRKLQSEKVDILFIINDTFLVETVMKQVLDIRGKLPLDRQFVIVYYFPIDATPHRDWITECVMKVDFPIVYTNYGKQECYKVANQIFPMDTIGHGVDDSSFFKMKDEERIPFRKSVFKEHSDDFIILNVNRNQQRKDLHRSLAAFALFHKKVPKSFYFINCQMDDLGGNIAQIGQQYGLQMPDPTHGLYGDWTCPAPGTFSASQGYPIQILNGIYNSADLVISSTLGEGWGLSCTEAMACKVPILFPKNTSLVEIIGENEERGYFCKSGEDTDHTICLGAMDNNLVRPVINVNDMADKMFYIYNHKDEARQKAEEAFKWVSTWDDIAPRWIDVMSRAENKLKEIRGEI